MRRSPWSPLVVLVLTIALWAFISGGVYLSRLPQPGDKLVKGHIVHIELEKNTYTDRYGHPSVSYITHLKIKIINTNTIVETSVHDDWTAKAPAVVTFYYSGNPSKMVFLQEDTATLDNMNSGWRVIGAMLVILLIIFIVICIFMYIIATMLNRRAANRQQYFESFIHNKGPSAYTQEDKFLADSRQDEFDAFFKKLDKS